MFAAAALAATALTATAFYAPTPAEAAPKADPVAKPPMGWNTWYTWECNKEGQLTAANIKKAVDAIAAERLVGVAPNVVDKGSLKDAGYTYIGVDDCWQAAGRYTATDPEVKNGNAVAGALKPDPVQFPLGMKELGTYIHDKGLKFGLYSAPGTTCGGEEGSLGHEVEDAKEFALWGVDLLKYDWCQQSGDVKTMQSAFDVMRKALKATGRKIVYNINPGSNNYSEFQNTNDFGDYADTVRAGEDLETGWWQNYPVPIPEKKFAPTLDLVDVAAQEVFRSAPDRWVDWDYVQLMRQATTQRPLGEDRAQFALWAMSGGPLFFAANPATLNWDEVTEAEKSTTQVEPAEYAKKITQILTNKDLIEVNQSWGGSGGRRISREQDLETISGYKDAEVWAKPLENGDVAVALLNRGEGGKEITISTGATRVGLGGYSSYTLKDLWTGTTSNTSGAISAKVPPKDVAVYRLSPNSSLTTFHKDAGTYQLSDLSPWQTVGGYGPLEKDKSNGGLALNDGGTLKIGGTPYTKGLGTHADSGIYYWPGGTCSQFSAKVGIDDEVDSTVPAGLGHVQFGVYGDGRLLAYTDDKTPEQAATTLNVPIAGVKLLELRAIPTNDHTYSAYDRNAYDHADWADAKITCQGGTAKAASFSSDRDWSAEPYQGWGPAERDQSNNDKPAKDGRRIKVNGVYYPKGIGAHAYSDIRINVNGCSRFTAVGGVDAETEGGGSVKFYVFGDKNDTPDITTDDILLHASDHIVKPSEPDFIDVDTTVDTTTKYKAIRLVVDGANLDGHYLDHADWAGAVHSC
ncbi:NPCBM/NEW2 domain-containing protein [Streptomyces sp. NBC_00322]|uniref:NPCBM/NEW2 domain-containing protein n=1 Tax=Streptomyces sp. NBC_00322 TaxID=2975712 RepID=UPI002E2939A7|nr:NPCBM/NEW2 domain-containing protein [Streptomyces sp. NBC_00322]